MDSLQIFSTSTASTAFRLTLFSSLLFCLLLIPTAIAAQDDLSLVELSVDDHSKSVLLGDSVTFVFSLANFDEDFDQNVVPDDDFGTTAWPFFGYA